MFVKLIKVTLLTLLSYLLQVTVAGLIEIGGVAPNLALALIAIISVSLGRKYAFFISLTVGYLLEIMLPMLDYINMIVYPVCAFLGALAFSDKSERRLEELRMNKQDYKQMEPHLRTVLCAGLSTSLFESFNLFYTILSGVELDAGHIGRSLSGILYTMALTAIFQYPIRLWLGTYKVRKAR